jgi:hypothetical protein
MSDPLHTLCWQGWRIALPPDWSPVKIEGDFATGAVMIADLHEPRMAIRWATPDRRFRLESWMTQTLRAEIGTLMEQKATEYRPGGSWTGGRLFVEPEPPGRDVWVGQSEPSSRLVQVSMQSKKVSQTLRDTILPSIADEPTSGPRRWAIFDLRCTVPDGFALSSHRLNAGDLALTFRQKRQVATVRQIGPATLALARQPLERWIAGYACGWQKTYRELESDDTSLTLRRRRRYVFARWLGPRRWIKTRLDESRDRLVLIDAETERLADELLNGVPRE